MHNSDLKLAIAQINPIVGDIDYNTAKIIEIIKSHENCDIFVFPEMSLVGYPLQDHIYDPLIQRKNNEAIEKIKALNTTATIILGSFTKPEKLKEKVQPFYNSAIIIENNKIKAYVNKRLLPNYDVFDERRYFSFDNDYEPIKINNYKIGILICEDIWDEHYDTNVAKSLVDNGAELLIVINASPFHINKFQIRSDLITRKSKNLQVPIVYVNMVGGLDEIVYDGQSFISNKFGQIIFRAKAFEEDISTFVLNMKGQSKPQEQFKEADWREDVIKALKLNLYDYYHKSNIFNGVVLGLSGGVDSAFTAVLDPLVLTR